MVVVGSSVVVVVSAVVEVVVGAVVEVDEEVVAPEELDVVVGRVVVGEVGDVPGEVGLVEATVVVVVVVVVVGGGARARVQANVVVVASGTPMVVVVKSLAASGVVGPGRTPSPDPPPPSPPLPPEGAIGLTPVDAEDKPVNQSTPMDTAKTRPPARAMMTIPDMRRPTRTLLRSEKVTPFLPGPLEASCSAIRLARSSGLSLSLPLGWGNGVPRLLRPTPPNAPLAAS